MQIKGSFDSITTDRANGWLVMPKNKGPAMVEAWLHHQLIGEAAADRYRADLADVGLGDGLCGFEINFYRPIDPVYFPHVAVKLAGSDLELPRTEAPQISSLLALACAEFPDANKSRSIFGGLWTDRTDALALLQGRSSIGVVPDFLVPALTQFIADGVRPVAGLVTTSSYDQTEALPSIATSILSDHSVLPLIRQILEDNPLCVSVEPLRGSYSPYTQASTLLPLNSPTECLEIIYILSGSGRSEVVRSSHQLPEFYGNGKSRWISDLSEAVTETDWFRQIPVDSYPLAQGTAFLVGPGTVHSLALDEGAVALRIIVIPRRQPTPSKAQGQQPRQMVHPSGVAVLF